MAEYNSYLEETTKKAEEEQATYTAQQKEALDLYLRALQGKRDRAIASAEADYAQDRKAESQTRQQAVDEAAISRHIQERNIRETLANRGLAGSGMEHAARAAAQNRAATMSRRAEAQYHKAADMLSQKLRAYTEDRRQSYEEEAAQKKNQYETQLANHQASLQKAAEKEAQALYKASLTSSGRTGNASTSSGSSQKKTASKERIGEGVKGSFTINQMHSQGFIQEITDYILETGDVLPVATAIRRTIDFTPLSFDRICKFLCALGISDEQKVKAASYATPVFWKYYLKYVSEQADSFKEIPSIERAK